MVQTTGGKINSITVSVVVSCDGGVTITKGSGNILSVFVFQKTSTSVPASGTTVFDNSLYTTNPAGCPVTKFLFLDTTTSNGGLTVSCLIPGTSVGCRTINVPTNYARLSSSATYPLFTFKFTIEAKGGK